MDVMRTAVSVLGCVSPEKDDHNHPGAKDIADKLMASLGPAMLYWYHFSHNGKRIEIDSDEDSIGGHFLHLLHGTRPPQSWVKAMHTSLILYAEHEFNASTFHLPRDRGHWVLTCTAPSPAASARCGAEARWRQRSGVRGAKKRYDTPDEAEADIKARVEAKQVVIGFPVTRFTP